MQKLNTKTKCKEDLFKKEFIMKDYIVRGTAANNQVRAFAITNKDVVEEARLSHQTSPLVSAALGRLMTAASMMGSMLKNDKDLLTLQIRGDGPIGGLVVTSDSKANVKGYPFTPQVDLPLKTNGKLDVSTGLGNGILNIIRDTGLKKIPTLDRPTWYLER